MKITDDAELDRLESVYPSGPVHDVLMELKPMRHHRDQEDDPVLREELDRDITGWVGGLPELIRQVEME
jgi:hypothetical protein